MGKIISNGIEYVGLTNINGVYIDTNNIIVPTTVVAGNTTVTYTAIEDSYAYINLSIHSQKQVQVYINDEEVAWAYTDSYYNLQSSFLPLKKRQTLKIVNGDDRTDNCRYTIYGVQQGSTSQGSSGGIDYSTTEQKTGQKWVDGKDIYQKTYVAITDTQYSSENAYLIGTIPNGLDNVIDFEGSLKTSDGYGYSSLNGIGNITNWNFGIHISNTNLLLYGGSSFSSLPQNATCIVTIKYTKSTT